MTRNINSAEFKNRLTIAALMVASMAPADLEATMRNLGLKVAKTRKESNQRLMDCITGEQASVSLYFAIRSRRDAKTNLQTEFYQQKLRCHRKDTEVHCAKAPAKVAKVAAPVESAPAPDEQI